MCEESIFAIKTVTSFNGQSKQETRHKGYLETALSTIRKVILKLSVAYGLCNASIFITFAVAFAFGGYLVSQNVGGYNAGNVGGTLVMILTGAFGFGQTATGLQAFTDGLGAMKSIDLVLGNKYR
jgi:ATP-binding cassette subfamily B (MDR/TAP) protein 1